MSDLDRRRREGHRLLQVGSGLFLFGLLVGLAVPRFTLPHLAVAAHQLGLMQGTFLMVLGLVWPRLAVAPGTSRVGCALAIYGCAAPLGANLAGAAWGAGGSMMPIGTGGVRGTATQEAIIAACLISGALSMIAAVSLVVWGLRRMPSGGE